MKKFIYVKPLYGLSLLILFYSLSSVFPAAASLTDTVTCKKADCAALGYTDSAETECSSYIFCPFDLSYKKCLSSGCKAQGYDIETADKTSCPFGAACDYCDDPSGKIYAKITGCVSGFEHRPDENNPNNRCFPSCVVGENLYEFTKGNATRYACVSSVKGWVSSGSTGVGKIVKLKKDKGTGTVMKPFFPPTQNNKPFETSSGLNICSGYTVIRQEDSKGILATYTYPETIKNCTSPSLRAMEELSYDEILKSYFSNSIFDAALGPWYIPLPDELLSVEPMGEGWTVHNSLTMWLSGYFQFSSLYPTQICTSSPSSVMSFDTSAQKWKRTSVSDLQYKRCWAVLFAEFNLAATD